MTVVTTTPDATAAVGGVAITQGGAPGATVHQVLAHVSDTSYIQLSTGDIPIIQWAEPSIPVGAIVKRYTVRIRRGTGANPQAAYQVTLQDGVSVKKSGTFNGQTAISTTTVLVWDTDTDFRFSNARWNVYHSGGTDERWYELYLDTTYVAVPALTVDNPTGTLDKANKPTVTWTPTLDADGGSQTKYQVKVFDTATFSAGGFDPAESTPDYDSGVLNGADTDHQVATPLANDTYRAYVRIAQEVNGADFWSAWAFVGFVENVALPPTPSIVASAENANGRNLLTITEGTATGSISDWFEIERSTDGGVTWEDIRARLGDGIVEVPYVAAVGVLADSADGTTHAVPLPVPPDGGGILEDDIVVIISGMDGNQTFTWPVGWTEIKDAAGNGSAVRVGVAWKRMAGSETGTVTVTTSGSEGGGTQAILIRGAHATSAPEISAGVNAATANPDPDNLDPAGWTTENTLWIAAMVNDDGVGTVAVTAGPTNFYEPPGGTALSRVLNTRWAAVTGAGVATALRRQIASAQNPGAFTMTAEDSHAFTIAIRPKNAATAITAYDYEVPNNVQATYRARSVHDYRGTAGGDLAASAWSSTSSATWSSGDYWLKHPTNPSLNAKFVLASFPGYSQESRQGVFQALGADKAVAITDTPGPRSGTAKFRCDTDQERAAFDALRATGDVLLFQDSLGGNIEDIWMAPVLTNRERVFDSERAAPSWETLDWIEVEEPAGNLVS